MYVELFFVLYYCMFIHIRVRVMKCHEEGFPLRIFVVRIRDNADHFRFRMIRVSKLGPEVDSRHMILSLG